MRVRPLSALGLALAVGVAGSSLTGCRIMRASGKAAGALFSSPRKVEKLKEPIDRNARLAVLWVGHATALVQIDDKVILTDPVFTSSVGQVSKRLVEPGLDPANLPPIDAVMISHLHFDHLSLGSLSMIEPKVRMLIMPRTGVTYLTDFDFPVLELRTWQAYEKDGLRITATPVLHLGFRYGLDGDWMNEGFTGYVIEYHGLKVYFGGDTAYDQKLFVDTGQRFPDLDVALLPIGPIEPRDFMRRVHVDPGEAIQAFFDLGAKRMVPVHYDTFVNSTDAPGDAIKALDAAKKKWDLGAREIVPLAIGERRVFVKVGEGPSVAPSAKPASAPVKSAPATPAAPKPDVPDDDKLD